MALMKMYWLGAMSRILSVVILMAVVVPSYFIVIWIFPGLEHHNETRGAFKFFAILYTLALFVAIAIVAALLFAAGMFLKKAFVASFSRGNSSTGK